MTLALSKLAVAAGALVVASAAAADDLGAVRSFRDWTVACDNGRICRAHGFPAGTDTMGFGLRLDRDAGRTATPRLYVSIDPDRRPPTDGTVTFATDRKRIGARPLRSAFRITGDDYEIADPAIVAAVIAAIRESRHLEIRFSPPREEAGEPAPPVSLDGASAALLWMDERQQRVGTVTALVRPGRRQAATISPPPPPPRAPAPRPLATGERAAPLSAAANAAVRALFRRDLHETCDSGGPRTVEALTGGTLLVGLRCWHGAYNESAAYYLVEDGETPRVRPADFPRPVARTDTGSPVPGNILTNVELDAATGRIFHFSKSRGLGDCGERGEWGWDGTRFQAVGIETMPHCRGIADAWFSLYRTR